MKKEALEPFAKALLSTLNEAAIAMIKATRKTKNIRGVSYYDVATGNVHFLGNKIDSILVREDFELLVIDGHEFYKEEMK